MIITCRNCKTSFKLSDELIKDTGSKVKCSKCKFIFRVFPPHTGEEQEPAENDAAETLSEIENNRPGDFVAGKSANPDFPVVDENSSEDRKSVV